MTAPFQPSPEDIEWRDALRRLTQNKLDDKLCEAVGMESPWHVREALAAGANARTAGDQPLRRAAVSGLFEIARVLLDAGANVHVNDEEPLCWAARGGLCGARGIIPEPGCERKGLGRPARQKMGNGLQADWRRFPDRPGRRYPQQPEETGSSYSESIADRIAKGSALPMDHIKRAKSKATFTCTCWAKPESSTCCSSRSIGSATPRKWPNYGAAFPKNSSRRSTFTAKSPPSAPMVLKSNKPPKIKFR